MFCKEMKIDIFQIHIKLADAHIFGFKSFQLKNCQKKFAQNGSFMIYQGQRANPQGN